MNIYSVIYGTLAAWAPEIFSLLRFALLLLFLRQGWTKLPRKDLAFLAALVAHAYRVGDRKLKRAGRRHEIQ